MTRKPRSAIEIRAREILRHAPACPKLLTAKTIGVVMQLEVKGSVWEIATRDLPQVEAAAEAALLRMDAKPE